MQKILHFVMLPTEAFVQLGQRYDCDDLVEPHITSTFVNGRIGQEHSQEEMKTAIWTSFFGNMDADAVLSDGTLKFLSGCLELGFDGCWKTYVVETAVRKADEVIDVAARRRSDAAALMKRLTTQS